MVEVVDEQESQSPPLLDNLVYVVKQVYNDIKGSEKQEAIEQGREKAL